MVNLIFGLQVWCEPSETAMGIDMNMNGNTVDENNDVEPMAQGGSEDENA